MNQWMGKHGGIQDDHIPFLQRGYFFMQLSLNTVYGIIVCVVAVVVMLVKIREHFLMA